MSTDPARHRFLNPNLAAFYLLNNIPVEFEPHDGLVYFSAPKTDEVYKLAALFNQDSPVPVIQFITALQGVKQKIYALRGASR